MRRYFVGGNWKCNGTFGFANSFPTDVLSKVAFDPKKVDVVVAPSTIHMSSVKHQLRDTHVQVAAQNSSLYNIGAYTGELGCEMLVDA